MKKLIYLFVMAMLVSGCATLASVRNTNRENLNKLSIGMTKQQVLDTMGQKTITTNEMPFLILYAGMGLAFNEDISNPYRSEILQGKDKIFEVLYYYTDKKHESKAITDDDLTPLVFDDGKLIGWGQSFLQDNIQKYEIRLR